MVNFSKCENCCGSKDGVVTMALISTLFRVKGYQLVEIVLKTWFNAPL